MCNRHLAFGLALAPCLGLAQAPLEEVVVRAGFYESELMQSAGSISVIDEGLIENRSARHLDEVLGTLPNVSFTGGGGRARFVQIRGVGDLEQFVDPKHFPSVGVTIDGVQAGTTATGALLMDVQQVDVFRGPQGTRYGANALAGMVNIRTQDPGDSFEAYVTSGYARFDTWHVGGAVSGPIAENVSARLAVRQFKSDGYYDNTFLNRDDTNARDEIAARAKLHWGLGEGNDVRLIAAYSDVDNGYDAFSLENSLRTRSDRPGEDNQESRTLALSSNWAVVDGVQLETVFSWNNADEQYGFDEDWVFAGFCNGVRCSPFVEFTSTDLLRRERDVYDADLRLKSQPGVLSWVVGLYTQHRDEDLDRVHFGPFTSHYETERYAVYGQIGLELAPRWTLTGGLRYEHFEDEYTDSFALDTDSSEDYWTGDLTLEFQQTDNVLWYATLSRGVKPGGVNTDTSANIPFVAPVFQTFLDGRQRFGSESLFNKELGVKATLLEDRMRLRLTGFHMDRYNAQLESFIFDPFLSFVFTGYLDDSSDAQNYGAELELEYAANRYVDLFANVGYLETNVDGINVFDLETLTFRSFNDREQAKSPNWTYNLGMNLTLNDRWHGRLEVEGRDKQFFGYYHDGEIDAYVLTHASVSYDVGEVTVQAWVRNLFDEDFDIHGLFFANDPRDSFSVNRSYYQRGEPRMYGVNLSYRF